MHVIVQQNLPSTLHGTTAHCVAWNSTWKNAVPLAAIWNRIAGPGARERLARWTISTRGRLDGRWPGLLTVIWIFVLSRFVFYIAATFAVWVLPEDASEPARLDVNAGMLIGLHWRWDAIHYYTVAGDGYESGGPLAFFPLLPLLIRFGAAILNGFEFHTPQPIGEAESAPLIAGILIGHAAALLAFWLLYRLAWFETGEQSTARRATLYAAIFPLAFLYSTPHTEALFLALSVGTFLEARRGNWIRAGLWAALASATRPVGILLLPAILVEGFLALRAGRLRPEDRWRLMLAPVLAPTGLLLFMAHLWNRTGDPLAFAHVQEAEWAREAQIPFVALYDGFRHALNPGWSPSREVWSIGVLELTIVVTFLAILVMSVRTWPLSYTVYGAATFAVILSSGWGGPWTMHGLGRYAMVFFPAYFTLARIGRRPVIDQTILVTSAALFAVMTGFYVLWYST